MSEPLLFKGDKLLLARSFLDLLKERPDWYDNYVVTLEAVTDYPDGKILTVHYEPKEKT
jgi:hypothetical protein